MPKKIAIIALLVIALIVVAGAAMYIFQQKEAKKVEQEEALTPTEEPVVQPKEPVGQTEQPATTESIDTSDWETYRNEEYGFELKYPQNWEFKVDRRKIPKVIFSGNFFPGIGGVNIYENNQLLPLKDWYSLNLEGKEFSIGPYGEGEVRREIKEVVINNLQALEVSSFIGGWQAIRTFFSLENKIFCLDFMIPGPDVEQEDLDLYYKLRDTFRLIR